MVSHHNLNKSITTTSIAVFENVYIHPELDKDPTYLFQFYECYPVQFSLSSQYEKIECFFLSFQVTSTHK
jgi:hypothetical protein